MLNKNTLEKINLIIAATCLLILGVIIGKYQERMLLNEKNAVLIPLEQDLNAEVPTVKILGLKDGTLVGMTNSAELRLTTETQIALVDDNLNFELKFNDLLRKNLLFYVPENMNYLASSQGKKFYNIYDSQAVKIAPQNRVFFTTREDALSAGYIEN